MSISLAQVFVSATGAAPGPEAAPAPGAAAPAGGTSASRVKVFGPAVDNGPIKPKAVIFAIVDCKEAGPGNIIKLKSTQVLNYGFEI